MAIREFAAVFALFGVLSWTGTAAADSKDLLASADRVAKKVAKLRGLAVKKPIKRGVMNREQLLERLKSRIATDYKPEQIRGEELALKTLGLIPEDMNYLETVLELLTSQIAGFYDPFEKQLYIADFSTVGGDFVMSHEICHALQDQHFNLKDFLYKVKDDADHVLARQALVEGDGLALAMEFMMDGMGQQVPWGQEGFAEQMAQGMSSALAGLGDLPLVLKEGLMFPYAAGTKFVAHFRRHHPWPRVDKVFAKPPQSTEQILHPEKYLAYEGPHAVTAKLPAALAGYKAASDNTVGEFATSLLLRQHGVEGRLASMAAAGWGGDRLVVYTPADHKEGSLDGVVTVLLTSWDDQASAQEYFAAMSHALPSLAGGPGVPALGDRVRHATKTGSMVSLERKGQLTVLVVGVPVAKVDAVANQALAWKVKG